MTVSGGEKPLAPADGGVSVPAVSGSPTGDPGEIREPTTVVWVPMSKEEREAYEKEHGYQPPGYRGTGAVDWFPRHHPDTAPCVHCGTVTDLWETRNNFLGGPPGYWGQASVCGVMAPVCKDCTRKEAIQTLERRQLNVEIYEAVRASELKYLAELRSELAERAA